MSEFKVGDRVEFVSTELAEHGKRGKITRTRGDYLYVTIEGTREESGGWLPYRFKKIDLVVGDRVEYTGTFSPDLIGKTGTVEKAPYNSLGDTSVDIDWDHDDRAPKGVFLTNVKLIKEKEETVSLEEKIAEKALGMADRGNWCRQGVIDALKDVGITQETIDKVEKGDWGDDPYFTRREYLIAYVTGESLQAFIRGPLYWEKSNAVNADVATNSTNGQWSDVTSWFVGAGYRRNEVTIRSMATGEEIA